MTDLALIETERLVLSGWRREQLDDLVRLHGDPEISRYFTASGAAWSRETCAQSLAHWIELFETQRLGKLRVTRKADGVLLGRAGFGVYEVTGEPEIGYALFREHQGHGYATEAASALRDWIFRATDWDHFIGFADVRNAPSLAVLRRIGMRETHVADVDGMQCRFHVLEAAA
ncbi:MAG: hypothetical protein BGO82_02855 [Devosia sp. 67-54]|uniref:GNAT family N-acetyltransferase n=1 Tax=unclassified Devosia TaxID=196773 RepID=UPI000964947E|nr:MULTISPECIES: GNAT family N-acetyltransferase [unclassified Devosia]MBN9305409.1 GNAT family N-acetyltransferase [Devosia sp.]OJX18999.1 MAG: hypothetical protein BGO82_02855 [Devosia sp. 67-54]